MTGAVTDSSGSTTTAVLNISVLANPNLLPLVRILDPGDSQFLAEATPVTCTGTATDAEEGNISSSLAWSSDKDGVLGSGASVNVASLSPGLHVITASSTDGAGGTGVARITVQVGTPTPLAAYSHNALGQRVIKTDASSGDTLHFIYDREGRVLAEIDAATGTTLREYLYVNGQQVALVDDTGSANEALYFVHNDHLGTPQKITDENQTVVWAADYEPFGKADVTVSAVVNNVRLPGQYLDVETGGHYNGFRDYDPGTGRYIQSDPLGLLAGLNTYAYVSGNPLTFFDLLGLAKDSITARIEALAARGDVRSLNNLAESGALNRSQASLAQQALRRLTSQADDFIAQNCKASVNREFPNQFRENTLEEIFKLARQGSREAQKAKKLLTDQRFRK